MLNEDALVLFAATGACALLILGVLELVTPTRARQPRRTTEPERDPWRRGRAGAVLTRQGGTVGAPEAGALPPVDIEPPIERLLLSEAATLAPPSTPVRGPIVPPPLPPPREPGSFTFAGRRPASAGQGAPPRGASSPAASSPVGSSSTASSAPAPAPPESTTADPSLTETISSTRPGSLELWETAAPSSEITSQTVESRRSEREEVGQPQSKPEASFGPPGAPPQRRAPTDRPIEAAAAPATPLASEDVPAKPAGPTAAELAAAQAEEGGPSGSSTAVDRCYELYEAKHYLEALAEATPVLENVASGTLFLHARDVARLWGLVGLARQAISDHEGARTAFEEAITASPAEERQTWQRHLGTLAMHVGRQLMLHSQSGTADAEQRVTTLHSAIVWLNGGLVAAPNDAALQEALATARTTLWPTYEQVATELIQRQDYNLARRLVRQALADEDCPSAVKTTLRDLLATTYSGEVGQLTAEAIRRMQEGKEDDAVSALDRAEALLATVPVEGVPDKRRQELERRLWWSYTKIGMRRLDGGLYEESLGPLLRALHFGSVGPERLEETKRPLARALESIAEVRSSLILRLAADGDRDGALVLCEKLRTFLRTAMERGMTKEELASSLNRTQSLFEKVGKSKK